MSNVLVIFIENFARSITVFVLKNILSILLEAIKFLLVILLVYAIAYAILMNGPISNNLLSPEVEIIEKTEIDTEQNKAILFSDFPLTDNQSNQPIIESKNNDETIEDVVEEDLEENDTTDNLDRAFLGEEDTD